MSSYKSSCDDASNSVRKKPKLHSCHTLKQETQSAHQHIHFIHATCQWRTCRRKPELTSNKKSTKKRIFSGNTSSWKHSDRSLQSGQSDKLYLVAYSWVLITATAFTFECREETDAEISPIRSNVRAQWWRGAPHDGTDQPHSEVHFNCLAIENR